MAYAYIAGTSSPAPLSGASGGTTSAIDTTGADLIVIAVSWFSAVSPPTVTDSKSNTWTGLTSTSIGSDPAIKLFYCQAPTVGSGHTFTITGTSTYSRVSAQSFSRSSSSPFDVESGDGVTSGTTVQPGSITPTVSNSLLVSATAWNNWGVTSTSINSGFTETCDAEPVAGLNYGHTQSYIVHTSGSINPTITGSYTYVTAATRIAAFKPATASVPTLSAATYVPGSITAAGFRPRVTATY